MADLSFDELPSITPDEDALLAQSIEYLEALNVPCSPDLIAESLGAVAVLHHDGKLSDKEQVTRVKLYQRALCDVPEDALKAAFFRATRELKFLPKPSELIAFAKEHTHSRNIRLLGMKRLRFKHQMDVKSGRVAKPIDEAPPTAEERDQFNRQMRATGLKTRLRENGEMYMLAPEDEDPAPADEPSIEGDGVDGVDATA